MTTLVVEGENHKRWRASRVYSGCSTCRLRKIKCDKRRPTCYNCQKSRRHICDGYDNEGTSSTSEARGLPRGGGSQTDLYNVTTVDNTNRRSHIQSVSARGYTRSPGRVVDPYNDDASLGSNRVDTDGRTILPITLSTQESNGSLGIETEIDTDIHGPPWIWRPGTAIQDIDLQVLNPSGIFSPSVLDLTFEYDPPVPSTRPRQNNSITPWSELDTTSIDYQSALEPLLHHYQTHVCQLMMPTSAPAHNPWLQLYLPLAMTEPLNPPKKCLLSTLLAVAAFNKAELSPNERAQFKRQGAELMNEAGSILKDFTEQNEYSSGMKLGQILDDGDKQALLAAALTMTTIEVFNGGVEGKGHESLNIGRSIILLTGGIRWWLADPTRSTLLQIFRCLSIVAQTSGWQPLNHAQRNNRDHSFPHIERSGCDRRDDDLIEDIDMTFFGQSPGPTYTLDVSFGIARRTLECLNSIVALSETKRSLGDGESWPDASVALLTGLEDKIFDVLDDGSLSADSTSEMTDDEEIPSYISQEIKENHEWAFHYSTAIFYRRALCNGKASLQFPLPNSNRSLHMRMSGQELVSKALEHLENIDAIAGDIPVANTLWPAFIAAVEAIETPLRHRALIWFARAKRHGIGNIAKAKVLVMEVWRRVDRWAWVSPGLKGRDLDLSSIDWRKVMQEKNMYIMLT